jgi:hypothetical protein
MRIRISNTARQSGYGKDHYKKVVGINPIDKAWALDQHDAPRYLCFMSDRLSGGNNRTGTRWRWAQPTHVGKYWNPRVPPPWLVEWLVAMTAAIPTIVEVGIHKRGNVWHYTATDENGVSHHREKVSGSPPESWAEDVALANWCKINQ